MELLIFLKATANCPYLVCLGASYLCVSAVTTANQTLSFIHSDASDASEAKGAFFDVLYL